MNSSQSTVIAVQEQQVWPALQNKDPQQWAEILAEEFVYRSPNSPDQTKSEFIASITSFSATVKAITSDNLRADVFGNVAIVTGVQNALIELPNGMAVVDLTMLNNVFVLKDEQWRLTLSHAVSLPT